MKTSAAVAAILARVMGLEAAVTLYTAAGAVIEPWDLHIGAGLNVLGRELVIKEVRPPFPDDQQPWASGICS
jgi:hypothetical protein